ncbi:hypothetical protein [Cernens ardua]
MNTTRLWWRVGYNLLICMAVSRHVIDVKVVVGPIVDEEIYGRA